MPNWEENYELLEKRRILTIEDYTKMKQESGTWATHLAIAQEDPLQTTREKIFERARRLRKSVDPFFNPKT
jgi:hypothetical protein